MQFEIGIQSFFLSVIIILIIFGNGLVIASVALCRKLRTVTNLFTVSLALTDLTIAFLVLPLSVIYMALPPESGWPFSWTLCRFWMSCDVTCCTASIIHLFLISLDRYLAITDPLHYKSRMSKKSASLGIACAWGISMAISFVPIFLDWFSDKKNVSWATITIQEPTESQQVPLQHLLHAKTTSRLWVDREAEHPIEDLFNSTIEELLEEYNNRILNSTGHSLNFLESSTQFFFSSSTGINLMKTEVPFCAIRPNRIYAIVTSFTSFFLPLIVMTVFYTRIYQIAERQRIEIRSQSMTSSQTRGNSTTRSITRRMGLPSYVPAFMTDLWKKTSTVHCNPEVSSVDSINTEQFDDNRDTTSSYIQTRSGMGKQVSSIYNKEISFLSGEDAFKFPTPILRSKSDRESKPSYIGKSGRLSSSLNDFSKTFLRQEGVNEQRIFAESLSQQNLQALRVQPFCQNGLKGRVSSANFSSRVRDRSSFFTLSGQLGIIPRPGRYYKLKQQSDHKAIRTLGFLMGLFCACWMPFFIMYVVLPFCELESCQNIPRWFEDTLTWLGYCNSLFNPCVYALTNRDFKETYWKLIRMKRCSL